MVFLRERTDNERHDQGERMIGVLAARAFGAGCVSAGRYADYEQRRQQNRAETGAPPTGLTSYARPSEKPS